MDANKFSVGAKLVYIECVADKLVNIIEHLRTKFEGKFVHVVGRERAREDGREGNFFD